MTGHGEESKEALVRWVQQEARVNRKQALAAVEAVERRILNKVTQGCDRIVLGRGIILRVKIRKARNGRHPQTGKPMKIPAGFRLVASPTTPLNVAFRGRDK